MSDRLAAFVAVVLLFGSASTVVAASNKASHPRASHAVPASPSVLRDGFAGPMPQWHGRPMCDDGGGRERPCDFAGCGGG
jgi:hypothetical protein